MLIEYGIYRVNERGKGRDLRTFLVIFGIIERIFILVKKWKF